MISFNKSYLDRIATEKGFIRDNLEKVMRLSDILKYFHTNDLLSHSKILMPLTLGYSATPMQEAMLTLSR